MNYSFVTLKSQSYVALILALFCSNVSASFDSNPIVTFFQFMALGFGASAVVYAILGSSLALCEKLSALYMIPIFLVLMAAGYFTFMESVMFKLIGIYPGGLLAGALLSTAIYFYLVKKFGDSAVELSQNNDDVGEIRNE